MRSEDGAYERQAHDPAVAVAAQDGLHAHICPQIQFVVAV